MNRQGGMFRFAAIVPIMLLLVSCPNRLTRDVLLQVKDTTSPVVTITSPESGSSYPATVVVTGFVEDTSEVLDSRANPGGVDSLQYSVSPAFISGDDIEVQDDGSFSFQFPTQEFSGTVVITITAIDWNGNIHESTLTLKDDGAIPSFSAQSGGGFVTLSWDPVPLSESYTVFFTTNGTYPSEGYGNRLDGVSPPLTLSGLENGSKHVFRLKSLSTTGEDNYSDYVSAIPLSGTTLVPDLNPGYRKIDLEWNTISGADEFEVFRSLDRNGNYVNISGPIRRNIFSDTEVVEGQTYYYKVRPSLEGAVSSLAASGRMVPIPDSVSFQFLATGDTDFQAMDIRIQDDIIYIAEGYGGLNIYDFSDHQNPAYTGNYKADDDPDLADGIINEIAVHGEYACVGYGEYEPIELINITDPENPYLISRYTDTDWYGAHAIEVTDSHVFTMGWGDGLTVFDHQGWTDLVPVCLNFGEAEGYSAKEVIVDGDYLYFACPRTDQFYILDIQDPSSPTLSSSFPLTNIATSGIAVQGNYAYVEDYQTGMRILDISDRSNPILMSTFNWEDNRIVDIAVHGPFAFLTYTYEGIAVVDITDAANPTLVDSSTNLYYPWALDIQKGYAVIADDTAGHKIFYMASLGYPEIVGTYSDLVNESGTILVNDDYALVSLKQQNTVLSIEDPTAPSYMTRSSSWFRHVTSSGSQLYKLNVSTLSHSVGSLGTWDYSDPTARSGLGYLTIYGCSRLVSRGDYVYVPSTYNGFYIIDVSDPENPAQYGQVDAINATDVAISGDYAYVVTKTDGLDVVDISNPKYPTIVGSYSPSGVDYRFVTVYEDYLYIYDANSGMVTLGISNPSSPSAISTSGMSEISGKVSLIGTYGVAPGSDGSLHMLSFANPSTPEIIGSCPGVNAQEAIARGRYAYTYGSGVFRVIDLMP